MNEEKMITLETEDGERVDFYVLEETRINGCNPIFFDQRFDSLACLTQLVFFLPCDFMG